MSSTDPASVWERNCATYRRLKPTIDATYPHGLFLVIADDQVVATGPTYEAVMAALPGRGLRFDEVMIVQAGVTRASAAPVPSERAAARAPDEPAEVLPADPLPFGPGYRPPRRFGPRPPAPPPGESKSARTLAIIIAIVGGLVVAAIFAKLIIYGPD